jgi:menadiol prenyltransferase
VKNAKPSAPEANAPTLGIPSTRPSDWMSPGIRSWLVALRPWSFPASLVPVALTGAVVFVQENSVASLHTLNYTLCFVIVLSLHAAANLTNTYYDFAHGVDQVGSADDRALVDKTLPPRVVFRSAMACFVTGLAGAAKLATVAPFGTVYVVLAGALLAFFYTADPLSLKGLGLGDVTIFLCFGPLLMYGVAIATTGTTPGFDPLASPILYYSIPIGLLTVDILHINNERDIDEDSKAGLTTTAIVLGRAYSYAYHCILLATPYAMVVYKGITGENPMLLIVLLCLPWALYVTRRFKHGYFHELPQRIAQHNLMFGTLLVCALSDRMFFVRVMLACLYYLGGVNNIIMWTYNVELVHMKLSNVLGTARLPKWVGAVLFAGAIVMQLFPSVLFMLGFETKLMAQILLVFVVPITFVVHDLWTIEDSNPAFSAGSSSKRNVASRSVPTFPTEFDNEFVHFFKNVGMIGGLALFLTLEGDHLTEGDFVMG